MSFVMVCVLLIILAIHVYAAMKFREIAVEKGYENEKGAVLLFCILLPAAGYLLVCAMPDKKTRASMEKILQLMEAGDTRQTVITDELPDL